MQVTTQDQVLGNDQEAPPNNKKREITPITSEKHMNE
jgi:hypothetical protein